MESQTILETNLELISSPKTRENLQPVDPYQLASGHLWATHIGKFATVEAGDQKSLTGRVVNFDTDPEHYRLTNKIYLYDETKGELVPVSSEKITSASVEESPTKWKMENVETLTCNDQLSSIDEEIKKAEGILQAFIVCRVPGKEGTAVLAGKLAKKETSPGYSVYEITDRFGIKHLVDPDYLDENSLFAFCPEAQQADNLVIRPAEKPVEIIDKNYAERQQLIETLVEDGKYYDNPKFYEFYEAHPEEIPQLLERWYPGKADQIASQVKEQVDSRFLPLTLDPGIANRLEEFLAFVQTDKSLLAATLSQVRQAFSDHLGTTTIYRGMMLSDFELDTIKKVGVLASGLLDEERTRRSLKYTLKPISPHRRQPFPTTPLEEIEARLAIFGRFGMSFLGNSDLLSVTTYPEVATNLGYHDSHRTEDPDAHMYLFKMEVPRISLVEQTGLYDKYMLERKEWSHKYMTVDGKKLDMGSDEGIEIFASYRIPVGQIVEIKPITEVPEKYKLVES